MKHALTLWLCGSLIGFFSATAMALPAVVTMEVVEVNGSTAGLPSSDLVVNPGDSLKLEMYLQGWAPELLLTYQMRLDGTSLASGTSGAITLTELPCATDGDCFEGATCDGDLCSCYGSAYVEAPSSRPDHVFADREAIVAADCTSSWGLEGSYALAGTLFHPLSGVPDQGIPKHMGTLLLTVSEDAGGDFTLRLLQIPYEVFLEDVDYLNLPLDRSATLTLRVGADDCNGNRMPDDQDIAQGTSDDCQANAVPDECDIATGESADDDANGVPDECQAVPVPAISQWGLAILALLILTAAKIRRRAPRRACG